MSKTPKKIFLAGHRGMVGSALRRLLASDRTIDLVVRRHGELDLREQSAVQDFFAEYKFDEVYLAAARVGGIGANHRYPADFIYDNLMIEANVIDAAYRNGINKLLFLGSSCIYPRLATQPMPESALLSGKLEPTNEPYAIAKIAGIKLCESYNRQHGVDFRSVMPTNLYGEDDNFHSEDGHVIPAMMGRFHKAKVAKSPTVEVWGSGTPMREFLHVDDMAAGCIHVMGLSVEQYQSVTDPFQSHINIGTGVDCTVRELAETIARVVGFKGALVFDSSKPDGAPRKLLNVDRLNSLGWQASISLEQGLKRTYSWFLKNSTSLRGYQE